jgi:hypothetical protein
MRTSHDPLAAPREHVIQAVVDSARRMAVQVAGRDGVALALSSSRSAEALIDAVWCLPLTTSQRYRVADAMMHSDIEIIVSIGHDAANAFLSLPASMARCTHCTIDDLMSLRQMIGGIEGPADESDALHGRAPGPCNGERGGPGESPPGDEPG